MANQIEQAQLVKREQEIINDIKYKMNVKDPATAQGLLNGFLAKDTFQTQAGFNFLASLEKTVEHGKKQKRLMIPLALLSVVALSLGGFLTWHLLSQNTVPLLDQGSQSKLIAENSEKSTVNTVTSSSVSSPANSLTYLEAFPDSGLREYVLNTVFEGSRTESDILSDEDIAAMAKWTDLNFDTGYINLEGMSYFINLMDSEGGDTSSTDMPLSNDYTASTESSTVDYEPPPDPYEIAENMDITIDEKEGTYSGELLNGEPHGEGRFSEYQLVSTSNPHTGEIVDTNYRFVEYEGNFSSGSLTNGKMYMDGVLVYDGDFFGWKCSGKGKQYYDNGVLAYDGEYFFNQRHGQGKLYYSDGPLQYEGEFSMGTVTGNGVYY